MLCTCYLVPQGVYLAHQKTNEEMNVKQEMKLSCRKGEKAERGGLIKIRGFGARSIRDLASATASSDSRKYVKELCFNENTCVSGCVHEYVLGGGRG